MLPDTVFTVPSCDTDAAGAGAWACAAIPKHAPPAMEHRSPALTAILSEIELFPIAIEFLKGTCLRGKAMESHTLNPCSTNMQ